jgi:hypothetical protein
VGIGGIVYGLGVLAFKVPEIQLVTSMLRKHNTPQS